MPNWQDKVVMVMLAETSDLRELARMVGHDPAIFWRDANFRQADLSDQDLNGLDISAATLLSVPTLADTTSDIEHDDDPLAQAQSYLSRGKEAMNRAVGDWARAGMKLDFAVEVLTAAVEAFEAVQDIAGEAHVRRMLADALVLRHHAPPETQEEDLDAAASQLRAARMLFERLDDHEAVASCLDAHGMLQRFRSQMREDDTAIEALDDAVGLFNAAAKFRQSALTKVRLLGASREQMMLSGPHEKETISLLRDHILQLERIWSQVTGPVPADIAAAAKIENCMCRLGLAQITRRTLGTKAREEMRDLLATAMRASAENGHYIDWVNGQLCLAALDALHREADVAPAQDDTSEALDVAEAEALTRAQVWLADGDATLRTLISATDPDFAHIDHALDCYAEAEDLFGLLEDVGPVEDEPGQFYAVMRRGIAHLLWAADESSTGEKKAEAITNGRFALDLAAANLGGRSDVPFAAAEALDAQAFGLRLEAHFSTKEFAVQALAEAAALHRRASRVEGLPRAVSYRYRTHFFGAERELEERQAADPSKLRACRVRAHKALLSSESRKSDRTSSAEQASHMAVLSEYAMSVTAELKVTAPRDVKEKREQSRSETDQCIDAAIELATTLLMPLDWMLLCRTRAQLQRLDLQ